MAHHNGVVRYRGHLTHRANTCWDTVGLSLSCQELHMAELLISKMTNENIAKKLESGVNTMKTYVKRVFISSVRGGQLLDSQTQR